MMSIFEVYKSKEKAVYPRQDFFNSCLKLLQDAEMNDSEWIEVGEKAPTEDVLRNIFNRRTALTNPLWKKTLMRGLGYKSVNELMGNESN